MSMVDNHVNPWKEISFGAIAGICGKIIEFPFDTIKVRLQSSSQFSKQSALSTIKYTYQHEGFIKGFYQGLNAPLLGACLESAVLFYTYNLSTATFIDLYKEHLGLEYTQETVPLWSKCFSGGVAGFLASFVLTPIELVKCKLQVSNLATTKSSSSANIYTSIIKQVVKQDGFSGFWNGLSSTLIREIGGTAVWFGTYEYTNELFRKANPQNQVSDMNLLISGALAGVVFNLSAFPADTIKSNIQTFDVLHKDHGGSSFMQMGKLLLSRPGGIKNLYKGLGITLLKAVPANALIFYVYEVLKRNF